MNPSTGSPPEARREPRLRTEATPSATTPDAAGVASLSVGRLRARYVFALSLIALLTILSQAMIQVLISDQKYDSRVVNIAGRQRMLSQKVTKLTLYLATAESPRAATEYRGELEATVSLWERSHRGLQHGDTELGLPGRNSPEVVALFARIQQHHDAIVAAVRQILAGADAPTAHLATIRANEAKFLVGMDQIVFRYDQEAKDKVGFAERMEVGLMIITLLVLALEARYIFSPATRRIRHDFDRLQGHEQALERQRRRLESIVAGTNAGTWEWDIQTGVTVCNERWAQIVGQTLDELARLGIDARTALVHPEDLERSEALLRRHFEGELPHYACELRVMHRDGHWVWVLDHGQVSERSADGRPLLMSGIRLDISSSKRVEADLVEARRAAEAANLAKTSFLANMSHEIRTPLNAITGMAHLLRRTGVTDAQADKLGKIETAGAHLLEILNAVLDLSKIEAGKFVLDETRLRPPGLIDNVASIVGDRLRQKGLRWRTEVPQLPAGLLGDPTRIQEALLNYVTNAIKFTETGEICVRVKVLDDGPDAALLRFEVEDTGVGIPADTLSRLFSKFEQGDNSATRRHGGTGLGLSITKQFARLMGGDAGASSVVGQGSLFWFTVRLKKEGREPSADAPPSAIDGREALKREFSGSRLLLAEDDPVNREVASMLLEDAGLSVAIASNGVEAVELATREDYALILMDMRMPVMDGLEATRRIRGSRGRHRVPIIALTANAFSEDRARCIEAGMDGFLAKPVDPVALYATILGRLRG